LAVEVRVDEGGVLPVDVVVVEDGTVAGEVGVR
jgi:hypothetical protein